VTAYAREYTCALRRIRAIHRLGQNHPSTEVLGYFQLSLRDMSDFLR
jgi:hypothetical protein